jgi:lipopolysaccharide/colanic/teichoic acid biosynthesis glycosyltransferase
MHLYNQLFKRIFDLIGAISLLIILSPLFLIIILVLFFVNNGRPFFIQVRPGKNAKPFRLIKFKTMRDIRIDENKEIPHDSERLTFIGKFLRTMSLDELPQLINVLIGEMSLIGPRPLLMEYLPLYNEFQYRRYEVKPGITGWAQINGRKGIALSKRFELDVWYVDHLSFRTDLKIFWLTIIKIIKCESNPPGKLVIDVDDVEFRKRLGIKKSTVS